jgi:hypothetical protein
MLNKLRDSIVRLLKIDRQIDDLKINQGRILSRLNENIDSSDINEYEFKVFSQWGEDGIIQFLVSNLEIENRTFIEFGVEDFTEANCRFLLMKDNWRGFVIDGSSENIERLQSSYYYWRYPLKCQAEFITKDNINSILDESGFDKEVGILSIDIDGVDYHVLSELAGWKPSILIVEYNAVFGSQRAVTVPYDPDFYRNNMHYSNLYYGASLPAFQFFADANGYALVGVNNVGSNAFYVRKELLNNLVKETSLLDCFRDSSFREGRDVENNLTFLEGPSRRNPIAKLPLVDVLTDEVLCVQDICD